MEAQLDFVERLELKEAWALVFPLCSPMVSLPTEHGPDRSSLRDVLFVLSMFLPRFPYRCFLLSASHSKLSPR